MPERVASEDIVRLAVEACPSGMIMTDADGKICSLMPRSSGCSAITEKSFSISQLIF
jgi:hypothetical protein